MSARLMHDAVNIYRVGDAHTHTLLSIACKGAADLVINMAIVKQKCR